jgi:hypothetical protein
MKHLSQKMFCISEQMLFHDAIFKNQDTKWISSKDTLPFDYDLNSIEGKIVTMLKQMNIFNTEPLWNIFMGKNREI